MKGLGTSLTCLMLVHTLDFQVTVALIDLSPELSYTSVPRLSPHSFLQAKAKNTSHYAMLAGPSNIFLDNNFIAKVYEKLNHIPCSSSDAREHKVIDVKGRSSTCTKLATIRDIPSDTPHLHCMHALYSYIVLCSYIYNIGLHKPRELTSRSCQSK